MTSRAPRARSTTCCWDACDSSRVDAFAPPMRTPGLPAVLMVTGRLLPGVERRRIAGSCRRACARRPCAFHRVDHQHRASLPSRSNEEGVPIHRIYLDPRSALSRPGATCASRRAGALRNRVDVVNLHGFSKKAVMSLCSAACFGSPYVLTLQTADRTSPRMCAGKDGWRPGRTAPPTGTSA